MPEQRNVDWMRRRLLALAGLTIAGPVWARILQPTPRATAGPFYPRQLPLDDDNDLTQVAGHGGRARGQITELGGRVLDTSGRPVANVRVEIWQCDANGRYHHPGDSRDVSIDENFQGHGSAVTGADGSYRFRTIRPVYYPGRAPHIHAAVFPRGERPVVTQIYVDGEPRNAQDFLFNNIPADKRQLVSTRFESVVSADVEFNAEFDIVIGATPVQA